jgi:hypothetical protein
MVAAITDIDVTELVPNGGLKVISVQTRNTVDASDTIAIVLEDYGIDKNGFLAIIGFKHTTDGSVVVTEAPTTSVTTGTLTITVGVGTDNDTRVFIIYGRGKANVYS